jgi:hypothetical protein
MRTLIPIQVVNFRNRLQRQLPLPLQIWAKQQAQQIVRSRRFGRWEQMQLNKAIRQKLSQTPLPAGTNLQQCVFRMEYMALDEDLLWYKEQVASIDSQMASANLTNLQKQQLGDERQLMSATLQNMQQQLQMLLEQMANFEMFFNEVDKFSIIAYWKSII